MIKAIHIFNNHKHVESHVNRFFHAGFENTFVFLVDQEHYTGANSSIIRQVKIFSMEFESLIEEAGSNDLVFIYNLDYPKAWLINRLKNKPSCFWYFYGTELYNNKFIFKGALYSQLTQSVLHINWLTKRISGIKHKLSRLKYKILRKVPTYDEIEKAMHKIDYFITYAKEEYEYLQNNLMFELPKFIPLPLNGIKEDAMPPAEDNAVQLLMGNSASPDNNHFDIINLLQNLKFKDRVIVPISYGEDELYKKKLSKKLANSNLRVMLLSDLLDFEAYKKYVAGCSAAVFNSYRQLALGNIFLCLCAGVKIYLNESNTYFLWLKKCGFIIFSVQLDLVSDIKNNQLYLTQAQQLINRRVYAGMNNPKNNELFIEDIINLVAIKPNRN